jgi:hypothetical protein
MRGWPDVIRPNNTRDLASHTPVNGAVGGKRVFPDRRTRGRSEDRIESRDDASRAYHRPRALGTVATRQGRTVESRAIHGDVALAYNADARNKRNRGRGGFSGAGRLANELQLIYRDGWGVLDDDQHGRALFSILLHIIANTVRNLPAKMEAARQEFAPWLSDEEMVKLATEAIRVRRRWTADKLAQRIGLTYADRQRLGVTMIGAIDMPKAERDRLRKERAVAAKRDKRRAGGARTRAEYEANARALRAEAKALGILPDALRKRQQRARSALSQVRRQHKEGTSIAAVTLGTLKPDARPVIAMMGSVFVGAQATGAPHRWFEQRPSRGHPHICSD